MAKFLVTGGAGFIGSHLTDALLAAGHAVRVIDDLSTGRLEHLDRRAEFIRGDIADIALIREAARGMDGCFHLAAIASVQRCTEDWLETHHTNMAGTVAVLDACRRAGNIPVVYASSAAVYGAQPVVPIAETARPAPRSAYGADKLGAELQAGAAFITHGLPSLGLRFFNVYGPRQDANSPCSGVISIFAARLRQGLELTLFGDGVQARDFIHVDDIVRHLTAGMTQLRRAPAALVANACTGRATTIVGLAHEMAAALGTTPRLVHRPAREGDIRVSVGDPSLARTVLGVSARIGLREGLEDLLRPVWMSVAA